MLLMTQRKQSAKKICKETARSFYKEYESQKAKESEALPTPHPPSSIIGAVYGKRFLLQEAF